MKNRISIVTALAVGATVVAGSAAIAANVGVLTSAEDSSIGNLTADTPVETPPTTEDVQVVDIYLDDPVVATTDGPTDSAATSTTVQGPVPQEFAVEAAGTVSVEQRDSGLFVAQVDAAEGWLWKSEQTSATEVRVTFASTDTIYEFVATVNEDGDIDARVDQPIVNVVEVPGPAPAPSGGGNGTAPTTAPSTAGGAMPTSAPTTAYDDDHDDDHDDEYEDHEDEDDDHEDDHEYEGGEDDD